jgi:hypothetical protein
MGFRRSDLQEAFFVPGDRAFRVWGFSTADSLADVLRPGYFAAGGLLELGELIYVRMQAQPPRRMRPAEPEPVRMALLMVTGAGERGAAAVRLVQDFGHTDAPAEVAATVPLPARAGAATAAPGRKRGRPAGSRSRTARATNGHDAGPTAL